VLTAKETTTQHNVLTCLLQAVEHFYMQLVSGQACLSAIGLDPAVPPAAGMQQQQQQGTPEPARQANKLGPAPPRRITYKVGWAG
jgi:hypothetical protein